MASADSPLYVGIDIGGTSVKFGVCDARNTVHAESTLPTHPTDGPEALVTRVDAAVTTLLSELGKSKADVHAAGAGAPGPLNHVSGVIYEAPNLPGWKNVPLRDLLHEKLQVPVVVENDANAAAYGESVAGAGCDANTVVMVTLGTGVGGGIIVGDLLIRGEHSSGGEIGHTVIEADGRQCACGQAGCLEQYVSATALVRDFMQTQKQMVPQREATQTAWTAAEISGSDDELAQQCWDRFCRYLAIGCLNLTRILDPDCIIIGGGVANAGDRLLGPLKEHFDDVNWHLTADKPNIVPAKLGSRAGLVGASALARAKFADAT